MSNNKLKNTRLVTFEQDWPISKKIKPYYKKGETHAIHYKTVEKLAGKKVKMKVVDNVTPEKVKQSAK